MERVAGAPSDSQGKNRQSDSKIGERRKHRRLDDMMDLRYLSHFCSFMQLDLVRF